MNVNVHAIFGTHARVHCVNLFSYTSYRFSLTYSGLFPGEKSS